MEVLEMPKQSSLSGQVAGGRCRSSFCIGGGASGPDRSRNIPFRRCSLLSPVRSCSHPPLSQNAIPVFAPALYCPVPCASVGSSSPPHITDSRMSASPFSSHYLYSLSLRAVELTWMPPFWLCAPSLSLSVYVCPSPFPYPCMYCPNGYSQSLTLSAG